MPGILEVLEQGRIQFARQRAPINPLDKCTVISCYPLPINSLNSTIQPGIFHIPAAKDGDIEICVVGTSSWFKEIAEDQPPVEIPVPSMEVARSIAEDFSNGLVGCNMLDKKPAIFYVPGPGDMTFATDYNTPKKLVLLKEIIKKQYGDMINVALEGQKKWFAELVKIADVDWARTNGNPLSVSDLSRLAADKLGMKTKPWMQDFTAVELIPCVACGSLRNPLYPICGSCKTVVDKDKFKSLGLVTEQVK